MPTILISGAANGLGRAFVEAYIKQPHTQIIAIDRAPIEVDYTNCACHTVDLCDETSILQLAASLDARSVAIDLVIHSAGIRGLVSACEDEFPDNVAACETLDVMDAATLSRTLQINSIGTFLLLRALLPALRRSLNPKVTVMSSRMGSLSNNGPGGRNAGGAYAYRASKAALNMLVRSFAMDNDDICFILCHPGRVETSLVRCKEEGAISASESVADILPNIEKWSIEQTGMFFDRFGGRIDW